MADPLSPDKPALIVEDRPHAPIVYFEVATTRAAVNGLVGITLATALQLPERDGIGVRNDMVVTGYLRSNVQGMISLRDIINQTLLALVPTETEAKN